MGSDYNQLVTELHVTLKKVQKEYTRIGRFDVAKLRKKEVKDQLTKEIRKRFKPAKTEMDIKNYWS